MRLLLSGTTIEYYITPARIRSAHAGQAHGQKSHNFIQVQGHKSHNLLEAPLGGSSKIENKGNSPEDEENINEANGDINDAAALKVAHENENAGEKSDHENLLEDDGANEYDVECPYKDSKLERLKCFLPAQMTEKGGPFDLYLEQRANKDKVIFLISIDSGYVEMGLNLHETSFKRLGITNYLYVCSDTESAHELESHGIDCFIYEQNIRHDKASRYMSKDFVRKTHVKTKIILAALYLGYNVFITDADIVYFKNPLDHLNCPTCDIEIQSDHVEENSGFYLSRPTEGAILLHQKMMDKANQSNKTSNQKALNRALKNLKQDDLIKVGHMDKYKFPCGICYFERFNRMWAGDNTCTDCVIVHNNWIMGKQAKVYRFKEHLLWVVDTNGYYSDPNRKYLSYDNPIDWGESTRDIEVATLKRALQIGHVLNRTVILPAFTCRGCLGGACKTPTNKCSLNTHLRISVFDGKFKGLYREHLFLSNPKVPKSIKTSVSPVIAIGSVNEMPIDTTRLSKVKTKTFKPKDSDNGASVDEFLQWFGDGTDLSKYSVLKFSSLYNSIQTLDSSNPNYKTIMGKIKNGFKKATYRQY